MCELEVARRELLCSADQEKRELRERTAEEVLEYKVRPGSPLILHTGRVYITIPVATHGEAL